jgi:Ni/Co efflux regulator RcnB
VGRIRGPAFIYPPGYVYRRWTAGLLLPAIFLSATYYYDGYASLGLSPPPPGYRWVRYGPDLVLVNLATGRVADVAYGVFL